VLTVLHSSRSPETRSRAAAFFTWRMWGITNTGLATIGALVVVLWSCVAGERMVVSRANIEGRQAMRELQALRLTQGVRAAGRRSLVAGGSGSYSKL